MYSSNFLLGGAGNDSQYINLEDIKSQSQLRRRTMASKPLNTLYKFKRMCERKSLCGSKNSIRKSLFGKIVQPGPIQDEDGENHRKDISVISQFNTNDNKQEFLFKTKKS